MPAVAASSLLTCADASSPGRGSVESAAVPGGVVAWQDGVLVHAGPPETFGGEVDERFDGCTIVPGFVDCHTHLPFFGWRDDEYEALLAGRSYGDLHREGGIRRSARLLAGATDDDVLGFCRPLVDEMLAHGTTALELKTGYGLSIEAELRQARLARRLAGEVPQTATVTLLACHAVPDGLSADEWVALACADLIPVVAQEGLADAVDVYVEDIAFSTEHLRLVAQAAARAGLAIRCHADQLGPSGAAEAAVALGARSADHLNHVSPSGVEALGSGETVAVLLPASTLMTALPPPPADRLLAAGAPVAVATDFNPGTSPVLSMPEAVSLACALYRLDPATALVASTANPAHVLGLGERLGSLAPGKRADFVILDGPGFRMVPYRPGHNPVRAVYVGGERVA